MYTKRIKSILVLTALLVASSSPAYAADMPSIASFTVSNSSVSSNVPVAFLWTTQNASGASMLFNCPTGVSVKTQSGTVVACGTRLTMSTAASDGAGYSFSNVSGTAKSVTATLYPKDATGADYDAGANTVSVSVGAVPDPITAFTLATSSMQNGGTQTFTWSATDIPGVNFTFDCNDSVKLYLAGSTAPLSCGTTALTGDQSASGSLAITAQNSTGNDQTITGHLIPAIVSGMYDATHGKAATFTVGPKLATLLPVVTSFTGTPTNLVSSSTITLTWAIQNATSSNFILSCTDAIEILSGTTTAPCNTTTYATPLPASGTLSFLVRNRTLASQSFSVSLLPQMPDGSYSAMSPRMVSFVVYPPGSTLSAPQAATPFVASTSTTSTAIAHAPITLPLTKGAKGAQVTLLQTFLAQDSTIYPELSISGYFGPATERAVKRFQVRYALAKAGDSAYGFVGPKTRAKINALLVP